MKILKELTLYVCMLILIIMLGSIWNVSNAQEITTKETINDIELDLMRNQLLKESISEASLINFEETRDKELSEMNLAYAEELRIKAEAERKAKEEAERKAKEEAERKAREEANRKVKEEAERKSKELASRKASVKTETKAEQQLTKADTQQQTLEVTATAYTPYCSGCSGITASGYNIRNSIYYQGMRIIAADTSILPMGTVVEIEGIGKAVVMDRGGAIKGNKIDVLFNSKNEAYSYGRQHNVTLKVIGKVNI